MPQTSPVPSHRRTAPTFVRRDWSTSRARTALHVSGGPGDLHGLALVPVPVQDHWLAAGVTDIGLAAEDAAALGVEQSLLDQIRAGATGGEGGVEAQPGVGPLHAVGELLVDEGADPPVAGLHEA